MGIEAEAFEPREVGKRIKYERKKRHMTQGSLAEKVGISTHYLYGGSAETGKYYRKN
ncbi:MAG: helix-turn-helix transcriptional regulator [Acetatifactor sp.]